MGKPARVCAIAAVFLAALLGAATLLTVRVTPAAAQTTGKVTEARHRADVPSDIVVKEMHIALLKFALNLQPSQEPYWAPVEAALRDLARWQAAMASKFDSVERTSSRSSAAIVVRIKRIAAMAAPLIRVLDENQRRNMMMLARSAGLEQLLASN